MVRRLIVLTLALFLVAPPGQAFAHAFGRSYDLPVPFWLYLFGASAVLLVSFVQIGLFVSAGHTLHLYPRFDLLRVGPLRTLLTARPLLFGLRLLAVALFVLIIFSGLLGKQNTDHNFAPTFVWITWWVGFSFFTAFVGNLWPLVNPWKVIFEWANSLVRRLGFQNGLELNEPYPPNWGVWPAVALYAIFVWGENLYAGSSVPRDIAFFAFNYSFLAWGGMVVFGKEAWLQRGEAFSVFFGLLGRFAPTEVRVTNPKICQDCSSDCGSVEGGCVNCYACFAQAPLEDRELNLRPWAVGLARQELVPPGGVFFVIFVLAAVAFDSLLETPQWARLEYLTSIPKTLGLVVLPLFYLTIYLGFMKLSQLFASAHLAGASLGFAKPSQLFGRRYARFRGYVPVRRLAAAYVYTLVPIAIAYQLAHYYTYLLVQGQAIIALISDPFGWGWDLFGTADYKINAGLIGAGFVWYSQVALIVAGHVVAVYLAHIVALRLLGDSRLAMRSQYPILALMILYTVFSLWILSQPIATQNTENTTKSPPQSNPTKDIRPPLPDLPSDNAAP
ncbi:MAG: hypothetical protein M3305_12810 [Actinomycetota bacterium]|nr:hypothetical protein [Actinomycetota bacterium]